MRSLRRHRDGAPHARIRAAALALAACHAPAALREGTTTGGLDLAGVPQHLQGVTCYVCRSVNAVRDAAATFTFDGTQVEWTEEVGLFNRVR